MRIRVPVAISTALCVSCLILGAGPAAYARDLSFEDRVRAQEAIERVYYSHQVGATRTFEEVVPRAVLEEKVRTYLKESAALETHWKTPITTAALDRELLRMARNSRLPGRLGEIRDALGGDGDLLLECLARPALADRLARSFFAADQRINPDQSVNGAAVAPAPRVTWDEWWARSAPSLEPVGAGPASPVAPPASRLAPGPGIEPVNGSGTAAIAALSCDTADAWDNQSLTDLPDSRVSHTAVWTGTEMIVWGGINGDPDTRSGARYDPATDTWSPTSTTNAPGGRTGHTAVWTGSEMIVWGGCGVGDFCYLNTGGRYNPVTDTWSSISTTNSPEGRYLHTAVWTGSEMIVWGGWLGGTPAIANTGGRYNPATDTWSPTSLVNAPPARTQHAAVWTGARMIVFGGNGAGGFLNTGGRYDPATDAWQSTSTVQAPPASISFTAVWAGTRMIVWGGTTGPAYRSSGGRYDPIADTWTPTTKANCPEARSNHTAVWTGTEMVVWGGMGSGGYLNTGGRYDPATDAWTPTAVTNAPATRADHTAVWTGTMMIVWGGHGPVSLNAGGRYDPATNSWSPTHPTSTTDAPMGRSSDTAVWTGNEMIVWGGFGFGYLNSGGRYNPATDTWTPTSTTNAPDGRGEHSAVWTGSQMIVWGGAGLTIGNGIGTGGRYDPITDTWTPTSTTNAPAWRVSHSAAWTGTRMVVWGGQGTSGFVNTGGLYDPATDTWTPTSTAGAPVNLYRQATVWTGSEMIVWGGVVNNNYVNSGARYNPATDTWAPTSTANSPGPRFFHTAVWTGTEMIVWGGFGSGVLESSGGRYDPATDTWTPTSTTNAPDGRETHSVVWTGKEMIVWGGWRYAFVNTGGRYNPTTDTWSPTTTINAPSVRAQHTAVWTGTGMIVWGGDSSGTGIFLNTGGRYLPGAAAPPPTADAGPDLVVECGSPAGTVIQLHGAATGCDALTYTWTGPFPEGGGTVHGGDASVTVPLGQTTITLTVTDGQGRTATDTVLVTVQDTTGPTLTVVADPQFLWPPNHDMVPVHIDALVQDTCDPNPMLTLVSVTSSEADDASGKENGKGGGHTTGDNAGADLGTADFDLYLRAERDGNGPGRIYTLTYRVVDASGNTSLAAAVVDVPHDQGVGAGPVGSSARAHAKAKPDEPAHGVVPGGVAREH
jgi:N-acetylneuraminic acid mutarotase